MTYEEFVNFVHFNCEYETIYNDSKGRPILVIRLLDAYGMVNKAKRPWVGLTGVEVNHVFAKNVGYPERIIKAVENLLKEKNGGK